MSANTAPRVLIVDDDEDACEMVNLLLRPHEIEVTCAQTPGEAWKLIKSKAFDLLMLDVWMPRLDGFEFCRQIRQFDSDTPILFYSGAAYEADRHKGLAAGASAYVVKPDLDGLVETTIDLLHGGNGKGKPHPELTSKDARSSTFFHFQTASD